MKLIPKFDGNIPNLSLGGGDVITSVSPLSTPLLCTTCE